MCGIAMILSLSATLSQQAVEVGGVRIAALGEPGRYTGFTVAVRQAERWRDTATVLLQVGAAWQAAELRDYNAGSRRGLELRRLDTSGTGGTPRLGDSSFARLSLADGESFPRLDFRLEVRDFDRGGWEQALGQSAPLCFFALPLPTARVWYVHGLLCPTPRWDPYPLSRPTVRGDWAEGWSYGAALGALTVPAMALWDDQGRSMVGYEWAEARLGDKSSKDLGIAYCAGTPGYDQQFIALLANWQKGWTSLTYPQVPLVVDSHLRVLYSLDLPSTADVNRLVVRHIYQSYEPLLQRVPAMNDLSWMVHRDLDDLGHYGPAGGGFLHTVEGGKWGWNQMFYEPDTVLYGAGFRGVDQMYRQDKHDAIERFEQDLATFLKEVRWDTLDGDRCCFWRFPLSGSWQEHMGGEPANTVHNVQQFGVGAAILACYANTGRQDLLPYLDGLFHWARHYVYTRGDIADIPESMFTVQTTALAMEFLMNYAQVFREAADEDRRLRAREAFDLAHMVVYRNANVTLGDSDERDTLSGDFMMPGNMAKFWLGQISNAELCAPFRSMIVMHVETGDPVFKWLVRGTLDRWWIGYKEDCWHTAENIDVWGESTGVKGKQTAIHDPCDSFWEWSQPVGDALMHVTCGAQAAMAFCTGTRALDVTDYAFSPPANFRFRILRVGAGPVPEPFGLIVSSPWRDLGDLAVSVGGRRLAPDEVKVLGTYREHLYVPGVRMGDMVEVGTVGDAGPLSLPQVPVASATPDSAAQARPVVAGRAFQVVDLSAAAQAGPARDWSAAGHWGGLPVGLAFAHGVPYWVIPAEANEGRWALGPGGSVTLRGAEAYLLAAVSRPGAVTVATGGREVSFSPDDGLLAAEGWPLCEWKLRLLAAKLSGGSGELRVTEGGLVVAVTVLTDGPALAETLMAPAPPPRAVAEPALPEATLRQAAERLHAAGAADRVPVAFLPPHGRTFQPLTDCARRLGLPVCVLMPEDLVDQQVFNAATFPVAVHTGDERYLRTVAEDGDAEEALLRYLREGGTLLVLGVCRPFTYALDLAPDGTEHLQQEPWVLLGNRFGLRLLGPQERTADAIGFEKPPVDVALTLRAVDEQPVLWDFPPELPFPTTGDLRYRPATREGLPRGIDFVPILATEDASGRSYGPAAALISYTGGEYKGARVLWVWGTLLSPPFELSDHLAAQVLTYAVATAPSPARALPAAFDVRPPQGRFLVAILPPDTGERDDLLRRACEAAGATPVFLTAAQFVNPGYFSADHFPAAIQAVSGERFLHTYASPRDGETAYKRYLEQGGALIVCQNATPFWYEMIRRGSEWQTRSPERFSTMAFDLGFETQYGFEKPEEPMWLELTEDARRLWPELPARLPLDYLTDQRWRFLRGYRSSAARRYVPLAYATRSDGSRYPGLAAARIDFRESSYGGARVFYLWGNMVEGTVGEQMVTGCLRHVPTSPGEGVRRPEP